MKKDNFFVSLFIFILITCSIIIGACFINKYCNKNQKSLYWLMIFISDYLIKIFLGAIIFWNKKYSEINKTKWLFFLFIPFYGNTYFFISFISNRNKKLSINKEIVDIFDKKIYINNTGVLPILYVDDAINEAYKLLKDAKKYVFLLIKEIEYNVFDQKIKKILMNISNKINIYIILSSVITCKKKIILLLSQCQNIHICISDEKIDDSLLIVDGINTIFGNFLTANNSLLNVLSISGKLSFHLTSIFITIWNKISSMKLSYLLPDNNIQNIGFNCEFLYLSVNKSNDNINLYLHMLQLFYRARKTIKIYSNFFVVKHYLISNILYVANKGVKIDIITSDQKNKFKNSLENYSYKLLQNKNINFYRINKLINKSVIIIDDQWIILSSGDFNHKSLFINTHKILILNSLEVVKNINSFYKKLTIKNNSVTKINYLFHLFIKIYYFLM